MKQHSLGAALSAALLVLTTATAQAGPAEAQACAAKLDAPSRAIFDAAARALAANGGQDPQATVRAEVQKLVQSGAVPMSSARQHARAAGSCLRLAAS